ncbi:MAG TPA: MarR family winged helix-turn-helix transcriptional regulator [Gemmatimonadaceae bacterium]|nr:MarR family winged helix-turn-helix transcriptional regulator [Gemmatimonadaceae bacterium]
MSSRAVERQAGISGAQLFVLRQLADAPRGSLSDLVARTLTHQSTVSEVVARLVDRGLVSRRVAADDARRAELALTTRGRALLRSAPPSAQASLVAGFERLTVTQRRALAGGLELWLDASGLATVEPTMFFEDGSRRAAASKRSPPRKSTSTALAAASPKRGGRAATSTGRRQRAKA